MEEELIGIKNAAVSFILEAENLESLEEIKLQFLGRSGRLTSAIKDIPKLPKEKRPIIGHLANEVKRNIEEAIRPAVSSVDLIKPQHGRLHLNRLQ